MARMWITCDRCEQPYRTTVEPWVCMYCEDDETADSLPAILAGINQALAEEIAGWITDQEDPPVLVVCEHDGCLLSPEERCPACRARLQAKRENAIAADRSAGAAPPAGWVRKGAILVRKKVA